MRTQNRQATHLLYSTQRQAHAATIFKEQGKDVFPNISFHQVSLHQANKALTKHSQRNPAVLYHADIHTLAQRSNNCGSILADRHPDNKITLHTGKTGKKGSKKDTKNLLRAPPCENGPAGTLEEKGSQHRVYVEIGYCL
jgi:hypothetical protein